MYYRYFQHRMKDKISNEHNLHWQQHGGNSNFPTLCSAHIVRLVQTKFLKIQTRLLASLIKSPGPTLFIIFFLILTLSRSACEVFRVNIV